MYWLISERRGRRGGSSAPATRGRGGKILHANINLASSLVARSQQRDKPMIICSPPLALNPTEKLEPTSLMKVMARSPSVLALDPTEKLVPTYVHILQADHLYCVQPLLKDVAVLLRIDPEAQAGSHQVKDSISHLTWVASGYGSSGTGSRRPVSQGGSSGSNSGTGAFGLYQLQGGGHGQEDGAEGSGSGQGAGGQGDGAAANTEPNIQVISIFVRNYDNSLDRTESLDITDIHTLFDFFEQLHGLYVQLGYGSEYHEDLYRMHPWMRFTLSYMAEDGASLDDLGRYDDRNAETAGQLQRRWYRLKSRLSYIVAKKVHRHV